MIADRHYNRQSIGAREFVPPGRCLVLLTETADALWITSWPFAEYVKHAWAGAWVCSAFRNESSSLASSMIIDAVAATRHRFVNRDKVRRSRQPGRCFLKAGFSYVGETKGGLIAMQMLPESMPDEASADRQLGLF